MFALISASIAEFSAISTVRLAKHGQVSAAASIIANTAAVAAASFARTAQEAAIQCSVQESKSTRQQRKASWVEYLGDLKESAKDAMESGVELDSTTSTNSLNSSGHTDVSSHKEDSFAGATVEESILQVTSPQPQQDTDKACSAQSVSANEGDVTSTGVEAAAQSINKSGPVKVVVKTTKRVHLRRKLRCIFH